ncbi:hypothetical protein C8Q74DRAFT_120334 [Fomes fomentarius]|nr:hypothetical protein C8Q74DRAFT_120334 [Fomes fomentarius]
MGGLYMPSHCLKSLSYPLSPTVPTMALSSLQGVISNGPLPMSTVPSIGDTLGALLISTFITLMLYGFMVHNMYRYIRLYPSDALILRFIAFGLFALDTVHSITLIHLCYHYLVTNYSNPLGLQTTSVWSLQIMPLVTGFIMLFTHSFYLRRIYIGMANIKWCRALVCTVVVLLMLVELALVAVSTYKSRQRSG